MLCVTSSIPHFTFYADTGSLGLLRAGHLNFIIRHERDSDEVVIKAAEALGVLVKLDDGLSVRFVFSVI